MRSFLGRVAPLVDQLPHRLPFPLTGPTFSAAPTLLLADSAPTGSRTPAIAYPRTPSNYRTIELANLEPSNFRPSNSRNVEPTNYRTLEHSRTPSNLNPLLLVDSASSYRFIRLLLADRFSVFSQRFSVFFADSASCRRLEDMNNGTYRWSDIAHCFYMWLALDVGFGWPGDSWQKR